ncbi:MAG: LytTR family DNA-binding domain-containing protein [Eubacteriales bacterium]|nr:LytTR family DNA-binding domain-containing protein [Eubacteriales bacterium]
MTPKASKYIRLTVNRQEKAIRVNDIIYAQVTDKLCDIYLVGHAPYHLFITISSLKAMLPSEDFLQISRNCLISMSHMENIDSAYILLRDGTRLPYSHRQKNVILGAFQQYLSKQAQKRDRSVWKINLGEEFRCYDHCPFPFSIIEVSLDLYTGQSEYYFRYANEALAALIQKPLHMLVNVPFFTAIPEADPMWRQIFSQCSEKGEVNDTRISSSISGHPLRVLSYQPHFGFCASLILEEHMEQQQPQLFL